MKLRHECKVEYRKMYEHSQDEVANFVRGHVKGTRLEHKDRIIEYRDNLGCEQELVVGDCIVKLTPEEGDVVLIRLTNDSLFELFEDL